MDHDCVESATSEDFVEQVVRAVATRDGIEPTQLPPLYDVCDREVTTALVGDPAPEQGPVEFAYCGYHVTLEASGEVTIGEEDSRSPPRVHAGEH